MTSPHLYSRCYSCSRLAKDMLSDKQCCLSARISFVSSCIMMAARENCYCSSLHFAFYSMKPNEVMLISDSFTRDATLKTQTLKSIGQWDRFAVSSDWVRRLGYTQENVLICPFRCYRQKTKATAEYSVHAQWACCAMQWLLSFDHSLIWLVIVNHAFHIPLFSSSQFSSYCNGHSFYV